MKNNKDQIKVKDLIINIVEEKLLKENFKNISIDSIAKELRISKRTIYEIFQSKEDILEVTVDKHIRVLIDAADKIADKISTNELSFIDGVSDLMKYISDKTIQNSDIYTLLPEKARWIDAKKKNTFMKFFNLAVNRNLVREEINPDIFFMLTRVFAFVMFDPLTKIQYNVEDNYNVADFVEIIYYGVLTDTGRDIVREKRDLLVKASMQ